MTDSGADANLLCHHLTRLAADAVRDLDAYPDASGPRMPGRVIPALEPGPSFPSGDAVRVDGEIDPAASDLLAGLPRSSRTAGSPELARLNSLAACAADHWAGARNAERMAHEVTQLLLGRAREWTHEAARVGLAAYSRSRLAVERAVTLEDIRALGNVHLGAAAFNLASLERALRLDWYSALALRGGVAALCAAVEPRRAAYDALMGHRLWPIEFAPKLAKLDAAARACTDLAPAPAFWPAFDAWFDELQGALGCFHTARLECRYFLGSETRRRACVAKALADADAAAPAPDAFTEYELRMRARIDAFDRAALVWIARQVERCASDAEALFAPLLASPRASPLASPPAAD
jgi:hypothetical protein